MKTRADESCRPPMPSRPFPFRRWLLLPLLAMLLLLCIDPTPLDFSLAARWYIPGTGFVGRQYGWLESLLHVGARQMVAGFYLLLALAFALTWRVNWLCAWRRTLGYLLLAIGVSAAIVPPLKAATDIQCPRDLTQFGGDQGYAPLLASHPADNKPGRCWPGGHASTGFSLFALFFALRDRRPRVARAVLAGVLLFGATLSLGRMLQGAHFLSHNLWTLLIDWTICLLLYRLILRQPLPDKKNAPTRNLPLPGPSSSSARTTAA